MDITKKRILLAAVGVALIAMPIGYMMNESHKLHKQEAIKANNQRIALEYIQLGYQKVAEVNKEYPFEEVHIDLNKLNILQTELDKIKNLSNKDVVLDTIDGKAEWVTVENYRFMRRKAIEIEEGKGSYNNGLAAKRMAVRFDYEKNAPFSAHMHPEYRRVVEAICPSDTSKLTGLDQLDPHRDECP